VQRTSRTHSRNALVERPRTPQSRTALTHRPSRTTLTALTHNTHGTHAQHSRHSRSTLTAGNKVHKPCVCRRRTTAEGITHRQRRRSERLENVSQRNPRRDLWRREGESAERGDHTRSWLPGQLAGRVRAAQKTNMNPIFKHLARRKIIDIKKICFFKRYAFLFMAISILPYSNII
jgi:hypothetical protein